MLFRSLLFTPGIQPKMIAKAATAPTDVVVLDLEDSVPAGEKARARSIVREALPELRQRLAPYLIVRVNGPATGLLEADLDVVVGEEIDGISLPKVDSAATVREVASYLAFLERTRGLPAGKLKILPWIETARAVVNAYEIAGASPRIVGVSFGAEDFTADMEIRRTKEGRELEYPRAAVAIAARAADVLAIDTPMPDFRDLDHLAAECQAVRALGYRAKYCIHPAQLPVVNELFAPSPDEVAEARRILEVYEEGEARGVGAVALDGVMIDKPIVERARRLLAWAESIQ